MTTPVSSILLFAAGLVLLVIGSNLFVDTAIRLAHRLRLPEMLIGATLVSFGTTLPEVIFSTTAAVHGYGEMSLGNGIGSVICNTALIAGVVQTISPSKINRKMFCASSVRFFLYASLLCIMAWQLKGVPRWCGLLLLALCVLYTVQSLRRSAGEPENHALPERGSIPLDLLLLLLQGGFLYAGAHLLVAHGPVLARLMGVPERVISLSLVALGTSLPELVTSVSALAKGHASLSLGNILGANILNILLVIGLSGTVAPLYFTQTATRVDLPVMMLVMVILCVPGIIKGKMMRWQGFALLAVYVGYLVFLF